MHSKQNTINFHPLQWNTLSNLADMFLDVFDNIVDLMVSHGLLL